MRALEMKSPVSHPCVLHKLVDPQVLRAFHGPETTIGPWNRGERELSFYVNAKGSPILLGSRVKARVLQRYDGRVVRNVMHLSDSNILEVESSWHVEGGALVARAQIHVKVPPPLNWLAERFVEHKARSQIRHFLDLASN